MRLIPVDFTQVNLFSKKVCNESASFFKKHKESYKRMIVEQGRHFWIYFSVSFKSYCLTNKIIEISGISSDMTFTKMIEEVLEVTDQMLTNGHVKDGVTLCEDLITVFQYRSFIDEIQSQSVMTNPFYMRDSEDTFRRLFGKPMEDKTLHLIKVVKTLQFLLHLGGCLFEMLRLWLQAEECKQDVTLYWKPPPEKPFHLFGDNSPTLKKACTVINKYEQALLDKTMYQLQDDTKEGRNLVNIKFENNSEDSGDDDDDPEKLRYKSKKLSIVIENEETKEVKKQVKLKYPRWETSSYKLDPDECPGCQDHLECIRKQVIDQGFVLPKIFEVHYEPNFHVKIRHCSQCNARMHDCDGPSHTTKSLVKVGAKRKERGLTRTALKQMAKKERRIQRKEKAGKESLDKLETIGIQKFVDECRKVPGFIEELERTKPKKLVGVPLTSQCIKPPPPNPNAGGCRIRILDDDDNEVDMAREREIAEEKEKMCNAVEDKESEADVKDEERKADVKDEESKADVKDEENRKENEEVAEDKEENTEQHSGNEMTKEETDEACKEVDQPTDIKSTVEMKQKITVPCHCPGPDCVLVPFDPSIHVVKGYAGTPVERPEDDSAEEARPNPNAGGCQIRILDDDDNEVDATREREFAEEKEKRCNAGVEKESAADVKDEERKADVKDVESKADVKDEENRKENEEVAEDKEENKEQHSGNEMTKEETDEACREVDQPTDIKSTVGMKQKITVPCHCPGPDCVLVPFDPSIHVVKGYAGTPVERSEDDSADGAAETPNTVDRRMSDESAEMKTPKLRVCGLCGKQETKPKTYKKCRECRQQKIKPGKYYCSRDCQVQDWKRRHCKEHLDRDREAEMIQWKKDNNNELSMDERIALLDINKEAMLNDVE